MYVFFLCKRVHNSLPLKYVVCVGLESAALIELMGRLKYWLVSTKPKVSLKCVDSCIVNDV